MNTQSPRVSRKRLQLTNISGASDVVRQLMDLYWPPQATRLSALLKDQERSRTILAVAAATAGVLAMALAAAMELAK